jgi:ribosomal protein S8
VSILIASSAPHLIIGGMLKSLKNMKQVNGDIYSVICSELIAKITFVLATKYLESQG